MDTLFEDERLNKHERANISVVWRHKEKDSRHQRKNSNGKTPIIK